MKFNKKGSVHPALVIFGAIIVFIIVIALWGSIGSWVGGLGGSTTSAMGFVQNSKSVHELVADIGGSYAANDTYLKPVSYIIGEVPEALIKVSSPIGAIIVIVLVFTILLLMFGDILDTFGSFSDKYIAWAIGAALTVIAANFKVVMLFAATGFALVSGVGVLAAMLGVLVPFLIYIVIHLLFLGRLKDWIKGIKTGKQFKTSMADLDDGIQGAKAFGKSIRK
jgi:hypothetical protein